MPHYYRVFYVNNINNVTLCGRTLTAPLHDPLYIYETREYLYINKNSIFRGINPLRCIMLVRFSCHRYNIWLNTGAPIREHYENFMTELNMNDMKYIFIQKTAKGWLLKVMAQFNVFPSLQHHLVFFYWDPVMTFLYLLYEVAIFRFLLTLISCRFSHKEAGMSVWSIKKF